MYWQLETNLECAVATALVLQWLVPKGRRKRPPLPPASLRLASVSEGQHGSIPEVKRLVSRTRAPPRSKKIPPRPASPKGSTQRSRRQQSRGGRNEERKGAEAEGRDNQLNLSKRWCYRTSESMCLASVYMSNLCCINVCVHNAAYIIFL